MGRFDRLHGRKGWDEPALPQKIPKGLDIIGRIANQMVHRDGRRFHKQIGKGHAVMTIGGMEG